MRRPSQHPGETLEERLASVKERYPVRRRYLVAVSGGCDSVVLLDILLRLGYRNLVVCHLNHSLRGRASGGDAVLVRRLAAGNGLPIEVGKSDVRSLAEETKTSLETAGRNARHAFFREVGRRHRCRRVFLAHHADDQVETILMNFFRGAGGAGRAGLVERTDIGKPGLTLLRPLLGVWKDELMAHAKLCGLRFREDASNSSDEFLRNRVRNRLLPTINEVLGRDVRAAIARGAEIAADEDSMLDDLAQEALAHCSDPKGLKVSLFRDLSPALQRRVLLLWFQTNGIPDLSFDLVAATIAIADPDERTAAINAPGNHRIRRRAGLLFIE